MDLFGKIKISTALVFVLLWGFVNPVFSETERTEDIRKLLKVSGILDQLTYMQDSLLNNVSMKNVLDGLQSIGRAKGNG